MSDCGPGVSWPGLAHILTDFIKVEADASWHRKKALDPGVQSLLKDFVRLADDEKRSGPHLLLHHERHGLTYTPCMYP